MSVEPDPCNGIPAGAALTRRIAMADARDAARRSSAIDDVFRPVADRIDDRTRHALDATFAGIVMTIESTLRDIVARGGSRRGAASLAGGGAIVTHLRTAPAIRTGMTMRLLLARVELDGLAARLAPVATTQDGASLLSRLVDCPDESVARAASRFLTLEAQRRDGDGEGGSELPAESHHQLVWQVAAAIRAINPASPDHDRLLSDAAWQCIAAHDEGDRVEAAAVRLVVAIDPRPEEYAPLMQEALGDRRPALFVAVLAQASGMEFDQAQSVTLDPADDRLLCVLRAIGLDREAMARIAMALAQADPRRDVDGLADRIDAVVAVPVADCVAAIAPLCLDSDFRDAIQAIGAAR